MRRKPGRKVARVPRAKQQRSTRRLLRMPPWFRTIWLGRRKRTLRTALIAAGLALLAMVAIQSSLAPLVINPTAYTPLLETIAKGESQGNYNAYFGNASNTTIQFTSMTVGEVLHWQDQYVRQGNPSSAVGKYQIVRGTLAGLTRELAIAPEARFDEAMQDKLAIALLERRGARAYVAKELTREQFAANLAKEWAALPRVVGGTPSESYYAQDGLNVSKVSIDEVYVALAGLERAAEL